ncbi:hypothetical protein V1520DRAFT_350447 [Lipomyces starkeyi]|uniref:Uncharacterized protein n=1 Tax=Lipomyces starkeyi NRRL Y-11557 TaxID=675824 RepID=A0A1E3PVJ5_LIPST|nr:hypothetical protein LIPSTDRAFT_30476 [Lipomyces starkeyi NRRL Y-11557]
MVVIGDLDNRQRVPGEPFVNEIYTATQPAKKAKRTVNRAIITPKTMVDVRIHVPTEENNLMTVMRRPLSPDATIEVPASWDEYQRAQELLDVQGNKFPRLRYDGKRQIAIVVAAPTPLHGDMAGELLGHLGRAVDRVMVRCGIEDTIVSSVSQATNITKDIDTAHGRTVREWDGAIRYLDDDDLRNMIAIEVAVSQSYKSLQEVISWWVCAVHFRLGIAMGITEGRRGTGPGIQYYANEQEMETAIQQARHDLRVQLQEHPFGPLVRNGVTWFGTLERVVIETFRCEDPNCAPDALLDPTHSVIIVRDGHFVWEDVPSNLAEVTLGDFVPSHVLQGNEISSTPIDFFQRSWVEAKIRGSILDTAVARVEKKVALLTLTGC